MALAGKHIFGSIEETRVTFVEKKIDGNRKDFLKKLLKFEPISSSRLAKFTKLSKYTLGPCSVKNSFTLSTR